MIICYVTRKRNVGWTNNYKDMESFYKEHPYKVIEWAFDEKDDLLNGDIIVNGKSILGKASQSRRLRSVIFTPTNEPDRTDISFCIEQDNKFVTYEKFKNVHTLATSEDDNKSKFYIRFGIGVEKLQIIRHCDESLPIGEVLKVV